MDHRPLFADSRIQQLIVNMPAGNAHHDSPAPTRILRPRQDTRPRQNTQLSKGRSNTGTSSHTMLSPVESTDYNQRDNHTPDETYRGSSPMSSPTVDIEPGNEASHVAVRGSVPPSPILKARRLKVKDNAYSPAQVPSPGGWSASDDKARTEDDALAKSESIVEVAEGIVIEDQGLPSIPVPRTANNGRVIAIDLDLVLPRLSPSANRQESTHGATGGNEPIQRAHVQVIDEPQMVISPTDMKGAVSGLLFALKHLRSLGHPLHLVASRAPSERSEIEFWLAGQGISLGTDDEDVVAALWLAASAEDTLGSTAAAGAGTGRGRGVFSRGTRDPPPKRGVSKLKVGGSSR